MISAGQLISERVMLKRDHFFAVSGRDGSMRPDEFLGDGLWSGDTRILSELRVLVDGIEPESTGMQADDSSATFELRSRSLHLTRVRFVDSGLHERMRLTNRGSTPVDAVLEIKAAADFAPMLAIRGAAPSLPPAVAVPAVVITSPDGLKHQLRLAPGAQFSLLVDVAPDSGSSTADFDA